MVGLEINLEGMKNFEIIKILTHYPQGHLEIKFDHIFWISDYLEPIQTRDFPTVPSSDGRFNSQPTRKPSQGEQLGRSFKKMSDVLGSMVC